MDILLTVLKVVVAVGLLNVWLVRRNRPSGFRGGESRTLREEFEAYGLNSWVFWLVGVLKVTAAVVLIVGLWVPEVVRPAAGVLLLLMSGAVILHFKIGDPLRRAVPAGLVLAMVSLLLVMGGGSFGVE